MKTLFILVSLFLVVFAHDKMNTPAPRVAQTDTTNPCGAGNGNEMTPTVTVTAGNQLTVIWDGNHQQQSFVTISLVYAAPTPSNTALTDGLLINSATGTTQFPYPVVSNSAVVTVPAYLPSGVYTLQWFWSAGFYSCADITVTGSTALGSMTSAVNANTNSNSNSPLYYETTIPTNENVLVVVSGPSDVTFVVAGGVPPTLTTYDDKVVGNGMPWAMTVCGDTQGSTGSAFVGVYDTANKTSPFTVSSSTYVSFLNINLPPPQIADSLPAAGNKFYWTGAYSTETIPKRIKMTVSSGSGTIGLSSLATCSFNPNNNNNGVTDTAPKYTGTTYVCMDLSTSQNIKYIQVYGSSAINYKLTLESGKCADTGPSSSATSLFISSILLVACILLVL